MANLNTARLTQLRRAQATLMAKLDKEPKSPKAVAWRARLQEYDESISNLSKGLRERPVEGPIGTNVKVN